MQESDPLKVLVLDFNANVGGMQRVMWNVLPELAQLITVYYIDALGNKEHRKRLSHQAINLVRIPLWPRIRVLGLSSSLARRLLLPLILVPAYFVLAVRLLIFMRINKVSVCWTNSIQGLVVLQLARSLGGPSIVFYAHGLPRLKPWQVWLIKRASAIIAVSDFVRSGLVDRGVNGDVIHVIPNGAVVEKLRNDCASPGECCGLSELISSNYVPDISVLLACSITPAKGVDVGIRAIGELQARGINAELRIAGGVPLGAHEGYLTSLHQLSRDLCVDEKIRWMGWRDDIHYLMANSDVVVIPSRCPEGFGMTAIEAMALCRPVVASDVGALPEIISDGITGLLVPPGDVLSFADALERLTDAKLRCEMGANAGQLVKEQYTLECQVKEIRRILELVVYEQSGAVSQQKA